MACFNWLDGAQFEARRTEDVAVGATPTPLDALGNQLYFSSERKRLTRFSCVLADLL